MDEALARGSMNRQARDNFVMQFYYYRVKPTGERRDGCKLAGGARRASDG